MEQEWEVCEPENKTSTLDGNLFCVEEASIYYEIGPEWHSAKEIALNRPRTGGELKKYYLVTKDAMPHLLIKAHRFHEALYPSYFIWQNYIIIAERYLFYKIDLLNLEAERIPPDDKYFDFEQFYLLADCLLATTAERIYRYDKNFNLVWETEAIACAGVLVHDYIDGCLIVHGENDPPGGWIKYKIDFTTGEVNERKWDVSEHYTGFVKAFEEHPEYMRKQFSKKMRNDRKIREVTNTFLNSD